MINWFDMPAEGLSNGGLFEVKELEVTENGTYETKGEMYNKVTVNVEGGGGSWQTVFEGSVTTEADEGINWGLIDGLTSLSADSIKVTFNGVEYTCNKVEDGHYGANYDESTGEYDWSEYPFQIMGMMGEVNLTTETAGTYTLKIEEPQSGGSSDFSTAEVTIINNGHDGVDISMPNLKTSLLGGDGIAKGNVFVADGETKTVTVILYKGLAATNIEDVATVTDSTGDYEDGGITGDCTITIS